jgi:hypothetical protein
MEGAVPSVRASPAAGGTPGAIAVVDAADNDLPPVVIASPSDEGGDNAVLSSARPVFLERCAVCHREPFHQGGVVLLDAAGAERLVKRNAGLDRATVLASVASGKMPLGGHLTEGELEAVRRWAAQR